MLVWHYTTGENFAKIAADKLLKPTDLYIDQSERPAVWFSKRSPWEPTASKLLIPDKRRASMQEMIELADGVYRIGVSLEVALHNWDAFVKLSGATADTLAGLKWAAKRCGANPKDWFVSFDPVPQSQWAVIETWQDGAWVPAPETTWPAALWRRLDS